jgi:trans-aconitate methyltransferase
MKLSKQSSYPNFFKKILNSLIKVKIFDSEIYWIQRYAQGGSSGCGSYNHLAKFKADILNDFVNKNNIQFIIEHGCGDGNQLKMANYPNYLGFDVSPKAIAICRQIFSDDTSKKFRLSKDYSGEKAELVLSLDVIYHLVEDEVYEDYMNRLFTSSNLYVIIYSSNKEEIQIDHVKHRKFTNWIEKNCNTWDLIEYIPNKYPDNGNYKETSSADFYIYKLVN